MPDQLKRWWCCQCCCLSYHHFKWMYQLPASDLCLTCAVVSILVQLISGGTLAAVPSWLVDAVVFTVAVVHSALINVCKQGQSYRTGMWWGLCAQVLLAHSKYCLNDTSITGGHLMILSTTCGTHIHTHSLPTKTRVSISVEALVALAEIRANNVATPSVGITPVTTWCTLILIWKERALFFFFYPNLSSFLFNKCCSATRDNFNGRHNSKH